MKQKHKNIIFISFVFLMVGGPLAMSPFMRTVPSETPLQTQTATTENSPTRSAHSAPKAKTVAHTTTKATVRPAVTSPKHEAIKNSVQHEYEYRIFATANDPSYASNWPLQTVNAPAAWDITTGNSQTIVAVIDSGFALDHEDLASRWATNTGETGMTTAGGQCWTGTPTDKQTNGCDDDNNDYVDDWRGWSFSLEDNNPQTGRQDGTGGGVRHGTQVSGLVGASGNNSIGTTAINWNTKIMPLQALSDYGLGYTSDVTAAIYYAVDNGAQVINMSLGTYANDPAVRTAITYATAHNVVTVAATGNCGDGTGEECAGVPPTTIAYPAAYPDVIAVGASTQANNRASFSSYGAGTDVVAPGYAVPSSTSWSAANPTALYSGSLYGTSFASPQVASLASLIRSIRPSSTVADVTALINATTSKPSGMSGLPYTLQFGHGVIDASRALSFTQTLNASSNTPVLLQAGTHQAEHLAPAGALVGSGCQVPSGRACTIQLQDIANGHIVYLPYTVAGSDGAGWSWSSDALTSGDWEIRAMSGINRSNTPYYLLKR